MDERIKIIPTGVFQANTIFAPCSQGTLLIDPGGNADVIIAQFTRLGEKPIAIALTHGHFDHIAAIPELRRAWPETPIFIHAADADFLGEDALEKHRRDFSYMGAVDIIDGFDGVFPAADRLLADDGELFGWRVTHTPGHTPGSVCFYNAETSELIAGDTLFYDGMGRTDLRGGDFYALRRSLKKLAELPPETRVLTGHGRETTIGRELY